MTVSSYRYDDFIVDSLKIRDEIAGSTGTVLEFGREEYDMLLDMIWDIEDSILHQVTDHDELTAVIMGRRDFRCEEEYTAFKRLIDGYFEREKYYTSRAMDDRNGRWAPTPPVEAYER